MYRNRYCTNGHRVAIVDLTSPVFLFNENLTPDDVGAQHEYCQKCGAKVLRNCQHCTANIDIDDSVPVFRPSYCGECGKAFPWTESALAAAREYADELDDLDAEEKAGLKATFDDLTSETPRTELALSRFKKYVAKVAPEAGKAITKIVVEVATGEVKRQLGLG